MINFQVPDAYTARRVEDSAGIQYVGHSIIGTPDSDAAWVIIKITTSGALQTIEYGYGSWDNRASLNYE